MNRWNSRAPIAGALSLVLLAACAAAPDAMSDAAGEANVAPDINTNYRDPSLDAQMWAERFEGESREVFVARYDVLEALGLEPGDRIADLGAGTGLYTKIFAEAVGPEGEVYAIDIAEPFLEFIAENAAADGLTNVTTVLGADRSTNLDDGAVDAVFTSDVYHHFEYPLSMNADIARSLAPGGEYIVVDFERIPGVSTEFVLGHVRAGKETVIEEVTSQGFEFVEEVEFDAFEETYFLRFRKL